MTYTIEEYADGSFYVLKDGGLLHYYPYKNLEEAKEFARRNQKQNKKIACYFLDDLANITEKKEV